MRRGAEVVGDFFRQFPVIAWSAAAGAALVALSAAALAAALLDERRP